MNKYEQKEINIHMEEIIRKYLRKVIQQLLLISYMLK